MRFCTNSLEALIDGVGVFKIGQGITYHATRYVYARFTMGIFVRELRKAVVTYCNLLWMLAITAGTSTIRNPCARRMTSRIFPNVMTSKVGMMHFFRQVERNQANLARLVIGHLPKLQKFWKTVLEGKMSFDSSIMNGGSIARFRACNSEGGASSPISPFMTPVER